MKTWKTTAEDAEDAEAETKNLWPQKGTKEHKKGGLRKWLLRLGCATAALRPAGVPLRLGCATGALSLLTS